MGLEGRQECVFYIRVSFLLGLVYTTSQVIDLNLKIKDECQLQVDKLLGILSITLTN